MTGVNDFSVVKVIQNPIIPQRFFFVVKKDTFNSDLCTEYEPHALCLQEGIWQHRISNVYIDNFFSTKEIALPKLVFDIKTNLHRSCAKLLSGEVLSSTFQSFYTPIMTVPVVTKERFCYVTNSNNYWYEVLARPYNSFLTRIELKNGFQAPTDQKLRVEIEYLFQRIK